MVASPRAEFIVGVSYKPGLGHALVIGRGGTAGFEAGGLAACPPVVEYSREFQAQAAEELAVLPDGSTVVEMMGDYSLLREQARACL